MKEKGKQKKKADGTPQKPLTLKKKRIFWGVTISLPLLMFLLLEISLRALDYGGNLSLFIDGPPGYEKYLRCNPDVARRYFYVQSNVPNPPKQLFLKQKPQNGYRIFVLGESSTAGFPYGNNASFPNILGRGLSRAFPEKNIEVINVAMSAISSYALLDLLDEILQQAPDALLIYTGHNEYYGALGVGSAVSLGNSRWLINASLSLQSIKTFLLLRSFIGWLQMQLSRVLYQGTEIDPSSTMMEKIVAEQTIPYGSRLYEAGKSQFEENMEAILRKAAGNRVPVVLSELVSNVRDQEPFISVEDKEGQSAKSVFSLARRLESSGEFEGAKQNYKKAKDLDALRFRAPEEFNDILRKLAGKYSLPIVPTVSYFEKRSPNGLIGGTLILEHLHPNEEGYYLLAKAFYETIQKSRMISTNWPADSITQEKEQGVTELDSVYGALVIRQLKGSWPFQPKSLPNRFLQNYQSANHVEEIAFRVLQGGNFSLESGHMELGEYYAKRGELDKALSEYDALITSIPHEMEFYQKAATVLLTKKEYERASQLLRRSLKYKESDFANKWIGQIALMKKDNKEAISFLEKADGRDIQVVFNLSRAYYFDSQWNKGEEYFLRLQKVAPKSEYTAYLTNLRTLMQTKRLQLRPR
jgi:tetratricopeptide (TPR) repeat protein